MFYLQRLTGRHKEHAFLSLFDGVHLQFVDQKLDATLVVLSFDL